MNPFSKTITFSTPKPNHFYCIKKDDSYIKIDPKKGDTVYEVPTISGGQEKPKLLLQIPIPLCNKHQHNGIPFGVKTCTTWEYIAIPVPLGSLTCRECLDKLYLPEPFLINANLINADLSDANLINADLSDADLRNADLSDANLSDADLSDADLSDADLRNANLSDADLINADLSDADLRNADLSDADLRNANLSDADLRNADLSDANLRNANLRNADLSDANLRNANLRNANNINKSHWNKFTNIDEEFKKLLSKERFLK